VGGKLLFLEGVKSGNIALFSTKNGKLIK